MTKKDESRLLPPKKKVCTDCTWELKIVAGFDEDDVTIGHAWIVLEGIDEDECVKTGTNLVRGWWPAVSLNAENFLQSTLKGVPGILRDDTQQELIRTNHPKRAEKIFIITCAQAQTALKAIMKWQRASDEKTGVYNLISRQCATFAIDIITAAGQKLDDLYVAKPYFPHFVAHHQTLLENAKGASYSPEQLNEMAKTIKWPDNMPSPPGIYYAIEKNRIEDVWN